MQGQNKEQNKERTEEKRQNLIEYDAIEQRLVRDYYC